MNEFDYLNQNGEGPCASGLYLCMTIKFYFNLRAQEGNYIWNFISMRGLSFELSLGFIIHQANV